MDGTVAEGTATVDESLVTGEAQPVSKAAGDDVVGGSAVQTNAADVRVGATLDRLVRLMWEIQGSTLGVQQVADRLASVFVPLVLVLGIGAVVVQGALGTAWSYALLSGLTVLIVSCPCAPGLATPLAVAAGTQAGLSQGIVVKHAGAFEQAADLSVVAFDKAGTLTTGRMTVLDTMGDEEALRRARAVEAWTTHPVGAAVVGSGTAASDDIRDVTTHPRGISATVDGTRLYVGHPDEHRARGGTRCRTCWPNGRTGPLNRRRCLWSLRKTEARSAGSSWLAMPSVTRPTPSSSTCTSAMCTSPCARATTRRPQPRCAPIRGSTRSLPGCARRPSARPSPAVAHGARPGCYGGRRQQ
ncbi:MAG: hypothetical protein BRD55_04290 [Bacteroidetes bacterium SW_9_63_38]|nr:MAG: hypothetical protein BRD55_04290 [Bacteroidetes bacterium SW_9_63_38]